jgi:hypothetical protein
VNPLWPRIQSTRRITEPMQVVLVQPSMTRVAEQIVQPWGEPGNYWRATIVRVCPTVAEAFEYLDYVELTLERHGLPLDTLGDLVVVDPERRPIARRRRRCSNFIRTEASSLCRTNQRRLARSQSACSW